MISQKKKKKKATSLKLNKAKCNETSYACIYVREASQELMPGTPAAGGHGQLTLTRAEFSRIWTTNEALLLKIRGQRKVSPRAGNKVRKRPVLGAFGRIRGLGFLCSNPALSSLKLIP